MRIPAKSRLAETAFVGAVTVMIMLVALVDRWPTVFYDSGGYYLLGEDVAQSLHLTRKTYALYPDIPPEDVKASAVPDDWGLDGFALGSRSSIYGFLMYVCQRVGTLWLLAAVQALAAAAALHLLWKKTAPLPAWTYPVWAGGLVLSSSVAFFAAFMMPDIFGGISAIGLLLLLVWDDRLRRWQRAAVVVALSFTLACHASNIMIAIVMIPIASGLLWFGGVGPRSLKQRLLWVTIAIFVAICLNGAFLVGVKLRTGRTLHTMPYLTARLLADGPGRTYLYQACDNGVHFALCRFRQAALADADDILWSYDPRYGVMSVANPETEAAILHEQLHFVAGVIAYDPLGVIRAEFHNWWRQLTMFETGEDPILSPDFFLTDSYWETTNFRLLLPGAERCRPLGPGCVSPFEEGIGVIDGLQKYSLIAALVTLAWTARPRSIGRKFTGLRLTTPPMVMASRALLAIVVVNGFISGVLSAPHPHYEARLIWVVPALAFLIWLDKASRVTATPRATEGSS
jgi:hypothetical protein